jgi:hypothetical protein
VWQFHAHYIGAHPHAFDFLKPFTYIYAILGGLGLLFWGRLAADDDLSRNFAVMRGGAHLHRPLLILDPLFTRHPEFVEDTKCLSIPREQGTGAGRSMHPVNKDRGMEKQCSKSEGRNISVARRHTSTDLDVIDSEILVIGLMVQERRPSSTSSPVSSA